MRYAREPSSSFVIGGDDIPRRVLCISGFKHLVARVRVFIPAPVRFKIHGAELPLANWIANACIEAAFLLFLANFEPILNEDDASIDDVFFDGGAEFEKLAMLLLGAKSHHILHAGAVVPAPVEYDDFAGPREVLHVALHVHLTLFTV